LEEIYVEINVEIGTLTKDINCQITNKKINLVIKNQPDITLCGNFYKCVKADESTWALEDKRLVFLILIDIKLI